MDWFIYHSVVLFQVAHVQIFVCIFRIYLKMIGKTANLYATSRSSEQNKFSKFYTILLGCMHSLRFSHKSVNFPQKRKNPHLQTFGFWRLKYRAILFLSFANQIHLSLSLNYSDETETKTKMYSRMYSGTRVKMYISGFSDKLPK